jgi:hypothetical protein
MVILSEAKNLGAPFCAMGVAEILSGAKNDMREGLFQGMTLF